MAFLSDMSFAYKLALLVALVLILGFAGYLAFKHYSKGNEEENFTGAEEEAEEEEMIGVQPQYSLYFFKATWCGHCKNFQPNWNELVRLVSSSEEFAHVQLVELDVDTAEGKRLTSLMQVKGFPTVLLVNLATSEVEKYTGDRNCKGDSEAVCPLLKFIRDHAPYINP